MSFNDVLTFLRSVFEEQDVNVHEEQDWDNDIGRITIKGVIDIYEPDDGCDCWQIYSMSNEEMKDEGIILNEEQRRVLNIIGEGEQIYTWYSGDRMEF